jgi:hypothetical protein
VPRCTVCRLNCCGIGTGRSSGSLLGNLFWFDASWAPSVSGSKIRYGVEPGPAGIESIVIVIEV